MSLKSWASSLIEWAQNMLGNNLSKPGVNISLGSVIALILLLLKLVEQFEGLDSRGTFAY